MVTHTLPIRKTSNRGLSFLLTLYYLLEGIVLFFVPESMRQKDVKNKVILITGGGSGIGQLVSLRFAKLGAKVVIWDINAEGMNKTVQMVRDEKLNTSNCYCYKINLCDREAIYDTAKRVLKEVGPVDILINNAGVVSGNSLLDIPDEKIEFTFNVNTLAHFFTIKAFLPEMIKRNSGHIVTIASVAGNTGVCSLTDYCASKYANVGFDLALRMELAQVNLSNIKTTIVKPYFISTGMFSGVNPGLLSFLTPTYVADRIVSGVCAETQEVTIPYIFNFLFLLCQLGPSKCVPPVYDFLGGFEFMSSFHGRSQKSPSKEEINNNNSFAVNNNNNNKKNKKVN